MLAVWGVGRKRLIELCGGQALSIRTIRVNGIKLPRTALIRRVDDPLTVRRPVALSGESRLGGEISRKYCDSERKE